MKSFLAKLAGIPSLIWNFYAPILKQIIVDGASALLPLALDIVRELADTSKTGAQKREAAVKKLTTAAVRNGIDASESLIRFTVESAVQKIKSEE
jgi:vacuolar-type H+-ATPase subunit D/Vma8